MSFVLKTYEFLEKIEAVFKRKSFRYVFVAIASIFLFFGVMNAYAADTTAGSVSVEDVEISPDWSGIKAFQNLVNGAQKDEDNMSSHSGVSIANSAYTIFALLAPQLTPGGDDVMNDEDVPSDMKLGLLGVSDNMITYAYSGYPNSDIMGHLAQEWVPGYDGSTTSLYAANDSGYEVLSNSGIVSLWNKTRDIAYLAFVVIMILVGFMIMFRSKIGGQTMVTLGNFLPDVIVSLVLITFSFAIAGIIIDIGGIIVSVLANIYNGEVVSIGGLGGLIASVFRGGEIEWTEAIAGGLGAVLTGIAATAIATAGGAITGLAIATGPVGLILLIVAVIIFGIILVGGVKVIITLYKAFFGLLVNVILGPIQIMAGAFPGKKYLISNWFLSIVRNVFTFPLVFAIVNFPAFLESQSDITLSLPGKLIYEDAATGDVGVNNGFWGYFGMLVLKIVVLYFAAEAPKFLEAWFPSNTPKAVMEAVGSAKASLSKVPLIGGLFK